MCTLITSKGTEIDENIANQNHATRTRTSKPGYPNLSNITVWHVFVFSHVPRRYAELSLFAYLHFFWYLTTLPSPMYSNRN